MARRANECGFVRHHPAGPRGRRYCARRSLSRAGSVAPAPGPRLSTFKVDIILARHSSGGGTVVLLSRKPNASPTPRARRLGNSRFSAFLGWRKPDAEVLTTSRERDRGNWLRPASPTAQ